MHSPRLSKRRRRRHVIVYEVNHLELVGSLFSYLLGLYRYQLFPSSGKEAICPFGLSIQAIVYATNFDAGVPFRTVISQHPLTVISCFYLQVSFTPEYRRY